MQAYIAYSFAGVFSQKFAPGFEKWHHVLVVERDREPTLHLSGRKEEETYGGR
jgi:hypothetical protein